MCFPLLALKTSFYKATYFWSMLASLKFLKYKNSYISVMTCRISYVIDQSLTIQCLKSQKNEQVFLKQGFEPWTACLLFLFDLFGKGAAQFATL